MSTIRIPIVLSWLAWAGWTILLCLLFLSPGDGTVRNISSFFGGTEITDAIGHILLLFVDTALLYHTLRYYFLNDRALRIATIGTLIFGLCAEMAQLMIPTRGASLIDLLAAFVGVGLCFMFVRRGFFERFVGQNFNYVGS